nr:hypothetical protein MACL_00002170 [Theileria orientalis]
MCSDSTPVALYLKRVNPDITKIINTISAYLLVCLLAGGYWNLLVPVKADEVLRGSSSQPAETSSNSSSAPQAGIASIDLNILKINSSDTYNCSKHGQYVIYTAKGNNRFNSVNEDSTEVWRATDSKNYSPRVDLDLIDNNLKAVTIHFPEKKTKVFTKNGNNEPWNEIDTTKVNPMSVYIDYPHESYICKSELKGDIRIFTAKTGFTFKGAHEYIDDNRVAVWKADTQDDYVNKIEVDLMNDDAKAVIIHFAEKKTKVLMKRSMCRPWNVIDTSKVNPISVNIQDKYNTYYCYNRLENGIRTFTARKGFFFNRVKDGNIDIWATSEESEYGKKVVAEGNEVIIYTGNDGSVIVFTKESDGKWIEDTSGPTTGQRVRLLRANPLVADSFLKLSSNEYTFSENGNVVIYHIADSVNCAQLLLDDALLWVYDSTHYGGIYPRSIYHDTSTDVLVLRFEGLDMTFEKNDKGQWVFTESGPLAIKLYVADPNDNTNALELPSTQYTVTESRDMTTFTIPDNVNIIALTYASILLWQHNPSQYGGIYPNSLNYIKSTDSLVLCFDGLDFTFVKNDQGQWIFTESGPLAIKLHVSDPNDPNNTIRLDNSQFTVIESDDTTTFIIADGVNCVKLIYGQALLWRYDPENHVGIYPNSLFYINSTDTLILQFEGLDVTFSRNAIGQWVYTETDTSGEGDTVSESGYSSVFDPDEFDPISESEGEEFFAENDPTIVTPPISSSTQPRVRLFKANPSDANNPLELGSIEYSSSTSGNVVKYQIANGVKCSQVMIDDVILWEYDSSKYGDRYPRSLYHDTSTDVLLLRITGVDITFENTAEGWIFTESGPLAVKFHVVDPNDNTKTVELPTTHLTLSESGDMTTFTIADNVETIALTYGKVLLWQHDANKHSGKHPKLLYFIKTTDTLVLRFEGLDIAYAKNIDGVWEYTETDTSDSEADNVNRDATMSTPDRTHSVSDIFSTINFIEL